jgi:hypothetical protein
MTSPWRPKIDSDTVRPPIGRRAAGQDNEEPAGTWAARRHQSSHCGACTSIISYIGCAIVTAHRRSHCRKVEAILTSPTGLADYETTFAPPLRCANLAKTETLVSGALSKKIVSPHSASPLKCQTTIARIRTGFPVASLLAQIGAQIEIPPATGAMEPAAFTLVDPPLLGHGKAFE